MHSNTIYAHLRACLAQVLVGVDPNSIRAGDDLQKKYHMDPIARSVLANTLNNYFAGIGQPLNPPLLPSETQAAQTIADLFNLLRARIPTP